MNLCLSRPVPHTILMTTLIPGNASAIPFNLGIPLSSYQQGEMKMAQKTQVILVDDIDGSAATQTVTFALDGVSYEIDLTDEHAAELRADLETWVGRARRSGGRRTARRRAGSGSSKASETQAIREWARANGYEVSDRGRIASPIRKAYDAAH